MVGGARRHRRGSAEPIRAPLEQTVRLIEAYGQQSAVYPNPGRFPRHLYRAGCLLELSMTIRGVRGRPLMVGASEILDQPESLRILADWIQSDPLFDVQPDLGLWTSQELRERAAVAMETAGFTHQEGDQVRRRFVVGPISPSPPAQLRVLRSGFGRTLQEGSTGAPAGNADAGTGQLSPHQAGRLCDPNRPLHPCRPGGLTARFANKQPRCSAHHSECLF